MSNIQPQIQSLSLQWSGLSIQAYEATPAVATRKPIVVLLHGIGGTAENWFYTLPALAAAGYRAIAPNLPGHGGSRLPTNQSLTPIWLGQALTNWLKTLAPTKIVLVGNSLGGWVALHTYLMIPAQISSLVLVASAGLEGMISRPPKIKLGASGPLAEQLLASLFVDPTQIDPQILQRLMLQGMTAPALMALRPEGLFQPTDLQQIHCPTLVIWGQQDQWIPVEWAQVFATSLPQARLQLLPDCGHLPQLEKPQAFNQCLIEALSRA